MTFEQWVSNGVIQPGKSTLQLMREAFQAGRDSMKVENTPKDIPEYETHLYCLNCRAETRHKVVPTGHDKDSFQDYCECLNCHWYCYGSSPDRYDPSGK